MPPAPWNCAIGLIARELRAVGIDANCAPVGDLITDTTHPFLKNRCYGSDPTTVSDIARAVARGHLAEGVLPVVKHMPGHGRTTVDTHHDLPTVTATACATAAGFCPLPRAARPAHGDDRPSGLFRL